MAAQAFLLIASFLLVLFVLARPLGTALARLINNVPLPGTRNIENFRYQRPRNELGPVPDGDTASEYRGAYCPLYAANTPGQSAVEPAAVTGVILASGTEHGGQLCYQHQLAVLRR